MMLFALFVADGEGQGFKVGQNTDDPRVCVANFCVKHTNRQPLTDKFPITR